MSGAPSTQLVVVGSSAGGIEALSTLVSKLPEDFPAPIVIAQHLDPERESRLQEILARRSTLPVRTVSDEEPLEAGVVFVVPANRHVNISDSHIGLQVDEMGRPKPSVDLLLGSAAEVFGERLIAVVLTGTGTDGTNGARLVSEAGGTVVVQDPETAEFGGMPGSLAPNTVDIVADLDEISRVLVDLLQGLEETGGRPPEGEKEELGLLLEELQRVHGVDFGSYKEATIMRRLKRRMAAVRLGTIGEYRRYVAEHPEEYKNLVNVFLINVTDFFRDHEHFEYLQEEVLPKLVEEARREGRNLRIWSAGCATGEEAYSLAIALSEVLGRDRGLFDARIFATDIDHDAIEFARRGLYPASSVRGLSKERLERYFDEQDGQYLIKKSIRSMIVFGEHDLSRRSPFPDIDLCMSRNVLIYFAPELQRRALQLFAYSLRDGGYLVLGKAETVSPVSKYFTPASRQFKVYRRHGERFLMLPLPSPPPSPSPGRWPSPSENRLRGRSPAAAAGQPEVRRMPVEDGLNRIPVGVVVVDRKYDIQAINNAARRLLSIHGVAIGEDFLHAMREAPYAEVRSALDAAFRDGGSASTGEFGLADAVSGERRYLKLDCYPRREEGERGLAETVLVVVNDVTEEETKRRALEERVDTLSAELESREREAAAQMARLRGQNQRLVDENRRLEEAKRGLANLNEGLQVAYEESMMAAEEAQAATEEVETLNEELQATNEELETLNEELQATIEELNTTNEDLQARSAEVHDLARAREEERRRSEAFRRQLQTVLEQAPSAIALSEGPQMTLRLVNPAFLGLFGRREGDLLGKPFPEALPELVRQGREEPLRRVYETGEPFSERAVNVSYGRAGDGEADSFVVDVFVVPLRGEGGTVEGVVVHLVNASDRPVSLRRLGGQREEESRLEAVLESIGDAVVAVNGDGRVLFGNAAFRRRFGDVEPGEQDSGVRLGDFEVLTEGGEPVPPEETPQGRASRGETFRERFAVRAEDGTLLPFEATGRPIPDATGGGVVAIREIPEG